MILFWPWCICRFCSFSKSTMRMAFSRNMFIEIKLFNPPKWICTLKERKPESLCSVGNHTSGFWVCTLNIKRNSFCFMSTWIRIEAPQNQAVKQPEHMTARKRQKTLHQFFLRWTPEPKIPWKSFERSPVPNRSLNRSYWRPQQPPRPSNNGDELHPMGGT